MEGWLVVQRFERGWMFRLQRGDRAEIYALLDPPAGLEQPVRGLGRAWNELGGPLAEIGWAVESEWGCSGAWQFFDGGLLLSGPDGRVYVLLRDMRWAWE